MDETWAAIDALLCDELLPPDDALDGTLAAAAAAGLPAINVSPLQGRLLNLIARSIGAAQILEIGTLAGYSAIWLARALPTDGRLVTLEVDPQHANVAAANVARAGLADRVDIRVGPALETLAHIDAEQFDLTFIDADKVSTQAYFDWAVAHTRTSGVVIVDNVVRAGAILDPSSADANAAAMRAFLHTAGQDPRVDITAIQMVGSKGHDGFALAVVC